jgi:acyl carrier protein
MNTLEKLQNAISATLKVPAGKITATTTDEEIGAWDSLGHVNLMMALEETFGVYLDVEDFPKLNSVPAIIEYLKQQGVE